MEDEIVLFPLAVQFVLSSVSCMADKNEVPVVIQEMD